MSFLYKSVFRRTSTYAVGVLVSAFFFERAFDLGSETLFRQVNKGKLWDDIKHKYE
ncbi:cytochrome b-c1 complex subunit 9 [Phlebotomus argentipes]|uniref:cytochrome b-c1 complex subunit 9 n=1 Tax=Phlebotomus argentipes TaxID=94469 RepID=UPI0028929C74|nr:cytochrome b-c1 complex subunit 9 [Phlebotomus argentipes]